MSSANVFLKMTLLSPETAMPVRLVRHAAGCRTRNGQGNGMIPLRPINGDRYAASGGISNLA
ncbi:MAG: hypothetical protein IH996_09695 [Proteobacteria bacterium]|nr:hypothetical protein [Pseudomonadota bacterium]